MSSNVKSDFAVMCKQLRLVARLKHREVAAALGVAVSTYGNVESSSWKVINRQRATKLIELYSLPPDRAAALLAAWDACPLSPFGEKRKKYWEKRNALRNKARNHDKLKFGLVECLGIILMQNPDDQVCTCDFGGPSCSVCYSLEAVGADSPFTPADRDKILAQLSKIRNDLMQRQATPSAHDTKTLAQGLGPVISG